MFRRYQRNCCMNNQYNNSCNLNNDIMEEKCQNNCNCACIQDNYVDSCACGFDEEMNVFPDNPMLGQSYVPFQFMDKTFKPCVGLKMGTIFPELVSPYMPCQSMREIDYIAATNTIKEGCNR